MSWDNLYLMLHKRMYFIHVSETYCIILVMDMYMDDIRINFGFIRRDLCNDG